MMVVIVSEFCRNFDAYTILSVAFVWACVAMLSHPAVSLCEFSSHVLRLKSSDCQLFSHEYESIDPGQQFTWEASSLRDNKTKNRYANVIAYDHSRVKLESFDGLLASDYINANFIDGYRRPNAYIATQVIHNFSVYLAEFLQHHSSKSRASIPLNLSPPFVLFSPNLFLSFPSLRSVVFLPPRPSIRIRGAP